MKLAFDSNRRNPFQYEHNAFEGGRLPRSTLESEMDGTDGGRALRLGALVIVGAALLAAEAIGLQWPSAPALLLYPLVVIVLVGAGVLLVLIPLTLLVRSRRGYQAKATPPDGPVPATADPSLLTLPSLLREDPQEVFPEADRDPLGPAPVIPGPVPDLPVGLSMAEPGNSTLLIPLSVEPASPETPPPSAEPVQTVTRLVDRMDALQRATGATGLPVPSALSPPEPAAHSNRLLHRLANVPTPPDDLSHAMAGRRCSDCGETLGSPPRFDPCADCGRALCARCYWRTSSGPQAHLCTTCFRDRSVPRPPAPMATIPRPGEPASVSGPLGRRVPPRRSVN